MEHPSKTLVMKFGGTSVGSPAAFRQAVEIVASARGDWPRLVVVASAMAGVTNLLLDTAAAAVAGRVEAIHQAGLQLRSQHEAVVAELVADLAVQANLKGEIRHLVNDFVNLCQAVAVLGEATPRALDAIAGLGERLSVRLLSAALESSGVPAQVIESTQLVVTDRQFQAAHPDLKASRERTRQYLEPLLAAGRVAVVTGFIGATPEGIPTTLGRGGSDYSAAILGAALPADEVWIWTDVDGVMTADPRLVPQARTIGELSYREIGELAYFGAKVLHPKTIRPVIEAGIGLRVCNTFNPAHPGTRLVADTPGRSDGAIKAVTAIRRLCLVTLEGRGMLGVPGVAARTFGAVAATGTSVLLITQASSEQSICFVTPEEAGPRVKASLEETFAIELGRGDIDRVAVDGQIDIVTIVGAGMRNTPGIAGRIFSALGGCGVNVIAIAQGSSEVSISLVVAASDTEAAVGAIHALI
jgi:aspartate kinase